LAWRGLNGLRRLRARAGHGDARTSHDTYNNGAYTGADKKIASSR